MLSSRVYEKLTPSRYTYQGHCGHVDWLGKRLSGCGKVARLTEYYYRTEGYDLTSKVGFCSDCKGYYQYLAGAPDFEYHQRNIDGDESVFDAPKRSKP